VVGTSKLMIEIERDSNLDIEREKIMYGRVHGRSKCDDQRGKMKNKLNKRNEPSPLPTHPTQRHLPSSKSCFNTSKYRNS